MALSRSATIVKARTDTFGRDLGEEPLDQVEPRGGGLREVQAEPGVGPRQAFTFGVLCVP